MGKKIQHLFHPINTVQKTREQREQLNDKIQSDAQKIVKKYDNPQKPPQTSYSGLSKGLLIILLAVGGFLLVSWLLSIIHATTAFSIILGVGVVVVLGIAFIFRPKGKR